MNKHIVIIWWGACWWTAALYFAQKYQSADITIIDSSEYQPLGVGESTVPFVKDFYNNLWIDDTKVLRDVWATYKIGICFEWWWWVQQWVWKDIYAHPFGLKKSLLTHTYDSIPFSYLFSHFYKDIDLENVVDEYSIAMSRWLWPYFKNTQEPLEYAYHVHAENFAEVLKESTLTYSNVTHVHESVVSVIQEDTWYILTVHTDTWKIIKGDLFIDCSWFHRVLLQNFAESPFLPYTDELLCDSAVVCRSSFPKNQDMPNNYTTSTTMKYWWRWSIPLQKHQGNGYVYSSKFLDPQEACRELCHELWDKYAQESIHHLRFTPGRCSQSWVQNCIWLWGAYGFIEPLEATGIYVFCKQLELVGRVLWAEGSSDTEAIISYNTRIAEEVDNIKDFIVFHYYTSCRDDTPFWNFYQGELSTFSPSFQEKVDFLQHNYLSASFDKLLGFSLFNYKHYTRILYGNRGLSLLWENCIDVVPQGFGIDIQKKLYSIKENIGQLLRNRY